MIHLVPIMGFQSDLAGHIRSTNELFVSREEAGDLGETDLAEVNDVEFIAQNGGVVEVCFFRSLDYTFFH